MIKPNNPYSKKWADYYKLNPNVRRSVGADGVIDDDIDEPPPPKDNSDDIEKLKKDLEKANNQLNNMYALQDELDKFKAKHAEAEKHRKRQEKEAQEKADEAARQKGDIEALEKSWKSKYTNDVEKINTELAATKNLLYQQTVGAKAEALASELAITGSAKVLVPHILSRLTMDIVDGIPTVKVLQNGKPSALTLDDLKTEIYDDKAFATILKGSSANGSGKISGASINGQQIISRSAFNALPQHEQMVYGAKAAKGEVKIVD